MASEYTIAQIIAFSEQAQVNTLVKITQREALFGGVIDALYSKKLYLIKHAVEFMNNAFPANPTLRQVAEYNYALARPYITSTATITITNPSSQSVNVGGTANFTVSVFVSNSAPYTLQWYRNNVLIPGATNLTYTLTNAQLSDSGAQFQAIATASGVGQAVSAQVTITVTAATVGQFAYMDIDPATSLQASLDPFTYQVTFPYVHNGNFTITLPSASAPNKFLIVKVPVAEPVKGSWFNDSFNNGLIPDFNWQASLQFGGFAYYYSRQGLSLNTTATLVLSP